MTDLRVGGVDLPAEQLVERARPGQDDGRVLHLQYRIGKFC